MVHDRSIRPSYGPAARITANDPDRRAWSRRAGLQRGDGARADSVRRLRNRRCPFLVDVGAGNSRTRSASPVAEPVVVDPTVLGDEKKITRQRHSRPAPGRAGRRRSASPLIWVPIPRPSCSTRGSRSPARWFSMEQASSPSVGAAPLGCCGSSLPGTRPTATRPRCNGFVSRGDTRDRPARSALRGQRRWDPGSWRRSLAGHIAGGR